MHNFLYAMLAMLIVFVIYLKHARGKSSKVTSTTFIPIRIHPCINKTNLNPDMATVYMWVVDLHPDRQQQCQIWKYFISYRNWYWNLQIELPTQRVFSKLKDSFKKYQSQSLQDYIKLLLLQYNKTNYNYFAKFSYPIMLIIMLAYPSI